MSSTFFAFLSRMKYINRWALMRNTYEENLSTHSFEVAALAHTLALIGNRRLGKSLNADRAAVLGLYHDMPEILTGDLPTPVKYYNQDIVNAYAVVEQAAIEKLIGALPEDFRGDFIPVLTKCDGDDALWTLVKAADKLAAYIKCVEERKAGNTEFSGAEETTRAKLAAQNVPEATIFMEEFLPAFEMTLDQISDNS
ncbi:MAG: 5'-deoxynucleotidase [Clostridia bacterium]|nr:5'-deoxynucleotidase [Clostridia bacterium]